MEDALSTLKLVKLVATLYSNKEEMKSENKIKFSLLDKI